MDDRSNTRREMHQVLTGAGERPAASLGITRRTFLHRSLLAGAGVGLATHGWFPLINTIDLAFGASEFKFAWISDTHLYPKAVNTRFVETAVRAVKEVQAMSPPADFLIVGGDIGQLGDPAELQLGAEILNEVTIKKLYIPGEHDWYLDMGASYEKLFGPSPWALDHKGVRFLGLDTISRAPDFWTIKKMSPKERMSHMAVLDGSVAGAWAGVGRDQLAWLDRALATWPKDQPVVLFSHNPLWEYFAPWNFWVRDWREVHEILKPFSNVTNVHGHVHQVLYNEIGKMRSIGMLATSWPWPYPPQGVPAMTPCQTRVDPGDPYDGVGWSRLTMTTKPLVDNEYVMWRKDVIADAPWDSGCGDNTNQILSPRLADQQWPHYGAYK